MEVDITTKSSWSRSLAYRVSEGITAIEHNPLLYKQVELMIFNSLSQSVVLAPLPYDTKALEPIIGEQTLLIHHGKHHAK